MNEFKDRLKEAMELRDIKAIELADKVQKLLGHSTLDIAKHYVNLYDSDIMQGYDQESPLELLKSKQRKDRIRMR